MPVSPESSTTTIAELMKLRRSRNQFSLRRSNGYGTHQQDRSLASEADPSSQLSPTPKSAYSTEQAIAAGKKNKKKKSTAFGALGCTAEASGKVSVPEMIRSSADWEWKKANVKKKKKAAAIAASTAALHTPQLKQLRRRTGGEGSRDEQFRSNRGLNQGNCTAISDALWCGAGIGLSADADAVVDSVDSVASTGRNVPQHARGKIDADKFNPRERSEMEMERYCSSRRAAVDPEAFSFWDTDPAAFGPLRAEPELSRTRCYRHFRPTTLDGLAEVLKLQKGFRMGRRVEWFDDWRLDIDGMSYEQLLELTDRIGYVSTGLKEDEIGKCIRKFKLSVGDELPPHIPTTLGKKCSICQEEFGKDDDMGKLECGHGFHIQCIKQWLAHKNSCPVCKTEPLARS